jgi:hypothetical protein
MTDVVAVLERPDDQQVLEAARALADLLGTGTRALQVPDAPDRLALVLDELTGSDVEAAVLSARVGDALCWDVVQRASKPLLVVPEDSDRVTSSISMVLLPLDGTQANAAGVAEMAGRLTRAGTHVLAMHVFDASTVPAFWDQAAHSGKHWTAEFLRRNLPDAVELDLRRGRTTEEVLAEARRTGVDLLMIGWGQSFEGGRAVTVRQALTQGVVPVLLVGTGGDLRADPEDLAPSPATPAAGKPEA